MVRTLISVLVFLWAVPVLGQKSVPAWPAGLDTVRYPIFHQAPREMSAVKMADLGLHPIRLAKATVVWNWTESRKRFLPDTLQPGAIVAADSAQRPVYKVDCTNRLAEFPLGLAGSTNLGGSQGPSLLKGLPVSADSAVVPLVTSTEKGFASRFVEGIKSLLRGLGWLLLGLLALAVLAAVVMMLLYFLAWLDNWMQRRRGGRPAGTPPAPAPLSSATAPATPTTIPPASPLTSTTEVPVATPASTRRFISYYPGEDHRIRFSGVRNVRFEEEGGVTTIRFQNT